VPRMAATGYRDYVGDVDHMRVYADYQERYAGTLRESDKVLLDQVRAHARPGAGLLDVGCSTGNLLGHLSGDGLELHGADLVQEIIAADRQNPALGGIEFHVADMLALDVGRTFDIVTVNAALMFFTPDELRTAITQLAGALAPGGVLIGFDFVHPFEQELEIVETSIDFPAGLRMFIRSERAMREAIADAGLVDPSFSAFEIPVALPRPDDAEDIRSWTPAPGLSFRGSLFQPWCHFTARKP
jgi:SAM-dependent methyltransferase